MVKACEWFVKAATHGDADAPQELTNLLQATQNLQQNKPDLFRCLEKAKVHTERTNNAPSK